jgi:hypothetical protein
MQSSIYWTVSCSILICSWRDQLSAHHSAGQFSLITAKKTKENENVLGRGYLSAGSSNLTACTSKDENKRTTKLNELTRSMSSELLHVKPFVTLWIGCDFRQTTKSLSHASTHPNGACRMHSRLFVFCCVIRLPFPYIELFTFNISTSLPLYPFLRQQATAVCY